MNNQLIYDIGMCNGEDTDYYLHLGYNVIGIEPSPSRITHLYNHFKTPLQEGRLTFIHAAVSDHYGLAQFHTVPSGVGWDQIANLIQIDKPVIPTYTITFPLQAALDQFGTPFYLKIDTEGNEGAILWQLHDRELPAYISTEAHTEEPVQKLYDLGYRQFQLVSQPVSQSDPEWQFTDLSTGPFGPRLPDTWTDFETVLQQRTQVYTAAGGWADVHAKL